MDEDDKLSNIRKYYEELNKKIEEEKKEIEEKQNEEKEKEKIFSELYYLLTSVNR